MARENLSKPREDFGGESRLCSRGALIGRGGFGHGAPLGRAQRPINTQRKALAVCLAAGGSGPSSGRKCTASEYPCGLLSYRSKSPVVTVVQRWLGGLLGGWGSARSGGEEEEGGVPVWGCLCWYIPCQGDSGPGAQAHSQSVLGRGRRVPCTTCVCCVFGGSAAGKIGRNSSQLRAQVYFA